MSEGPRRLYQYVGPAGIAAKAQTLQIKRHQVSCATDVTQWLADEESNSTATYIVDQLGRLWIASRHSEHIVCARGAAVLAAGEITFGVDEGVVEASYVTNQSTGFCPEPVCWNAVADALDAAAIHRSNGFDLACEFRRCECGQTNIVKNDVFECAVCERPLPLCWNYAG